MLSDPDRRARYDATGSTSDRPEGDEFFDWANFYRSQFKEVVTTAHIEEFRKKYQGSDEERADVLKAYVEGEGGVEYLFERIMCSEEERDLERFRVLVGEAVKEGEVARFERFWADEEGVQGKKKKQRKRKGEEEEAKAMARKMGVYEVLFGKDDGEGNGKEEELQVDREGEVEVSGEDSGDEEEDAGVEGDDGDDGFIDDDEENDQEMGATEEEPPQKSASKRRSTRAKPEKPSLDEEEDEPPQKSTSTRRSARAKPEKAPLKENTKASKKPSAAASKANTASKPKPAKSKKSASSESNLAGLEALIRSRQKDRFADMISGIEQRYVNRQPAAPAPRAKGGRGRKRKVEDEDEEMVDADGGEDGVEQGAEPTEEEFEKIREKLEAGRKEKVDGGVGKGKKRGRK